jgi:hypothetical protein
MIGLYHSNTIKYYPERRAWQNARRLGMELKKYNRKICREAMTGVAGVCAAIDANEILKAFFI